jgi:hypothetical protein
MPSNKALRRLQDARNSKSGWRAHELRALYEGFGFVVRTRTKHDQVSHPDYPELVTHIPRDGRVHVYSVTTAVKMIDKLMGLVGKEEVDE